MLLQWYCDGLCILRARKGLNIDHHFAWLDTFNKDLDLVRLK